MVGKGSSVPLVQEERDGFLEPGHAVIDPDRLDRRRFAALDEVALGWHDDYQFQVDEHIKRSPRLASADPGLRKADRGTVSSDASNGDPPVRYLVRVRVRGIRSRLRRHRLRACDVLKAIALGVQAAALTMVLVDELDVRARRAPRIETSVQADRIHVLDNAPDVGGLRRSPPIETFDL